MNRSLIEFRLREALGVRLSVWWYSDDSQIPRGIGVYLLYWAGDLDYIGYSRDLRARLTASHQYYRPNQHLVAFIPVEGKMWITKVENCRLLEKQLIQALHPAYNIIYNSARL